MSLHPTASEINFVDSVRKWITTVISPATLDPNLIINADDYEAVEDLFDSEYNNLFIVYKLGESHGKNQAERSCGIAVLTRKDPGNRQALTIIDHLKSYLCPGLSIPLRDFVTGDGEEVTQMTIMDTVVGPFVDERDFFRSKTISFLLGYAQIWSNPE